MGLRFASQLHGNCFFVTTTFLSWARYADIPGVYEALADSLTFCCRKYAAGLLGYVFMPSHIHLLVMVEGANLGPMMRDFKKYTAQKGVRECGIRESGIWMPRYDRVVITSEETLRTKLRYIHENPVRAGLTDRADNWLWSSASDYLAVTGGRVPVVTKW